MSKLLDLKEFIGTKASIKHTGGDTEWKEDLIQFINDETDVKSKEFFFYMLPAVRFTTDPAYGIACTDMKKVIWLNAPNTEVNTTWNNWYFIYLHECLHQMWDTFGAEDEIKKEFGKCDHYLMNIASDCVINEFLHINRDFKLKFPTSGLITAKLLKDKYNVDYDPRHDTQTKLYLKLEKVADKIKKDQPDMSQNPNNTPVIEKKTDEYVKGWNQAIEDWKSGKITKENIADVLAKLKK